MEVKTELSPGYEILGLIYCHYNGTLDELAASPEITNLGINAAELYKKCGSILKRYVSAFEKKLILHDGDATFFEKDSIAFLIFLMVFFAEEPKWINGIDHIPEDEVRRNILEGIGEWLMIEMSQDPTTNDIIEVLKNSTIPPGACWKAVIFLQEPKKQMQHLIKIIQQNLPAYQNAITAIEKPLKQRLEHFYNLHQSGQKTGNDIWTMLNKSTSTLKTITPLLIDPFAELVLTESTYKGLFLDEIIRMMENSKKARTGNPVFKAIGDSSKFDILLSLTHAPKYNLELAEQLGLTPATITHHMHALLLNGIVSVEKRDGRVYYTLVKEELKSAINQLQEIFNI